MRAVAYTVTDGAGDEILYVLRGLDVTVRRHVKVGGENWDGLSYFGTRVCAEVFNCTDVTVKVVRVMRYLLLIVLYRTEVFLDVYQRKHCVKAIHAEAREQSEGVFTKIPDGEQSIDHRMNDLRLPVHLHLKIWLFLFLEFCHEGYLIWIEGNLIYYNPHVHLQLVLTEEL